MQQASNNQHFFYPLQFHYSKNIIKSQQEIENQ